jgi:hypothetical protein
MSKKLKLLRWCGLGILIVWAAFWVFFNVASGIGEIAEDGWMALVMHLVMAVITLAVLAACWFWPLFGGIAAIGMGIFTYSYFNVAHQGAFMFLVMVLPLLLGGILHIVFWFIKRRQASILYR